MRRLAISLCLFICTLAGSLAAIPAQITIVPNAEVDDLGNLTQEGLERAGALAAYLVLSPDLVTFGPPATIFAARPTLTTPPFGPTDNTTCCILTVGPTSAVLKMPVHSGYAFTQEAALASFVLNNANYNGKNVLICWRPEGITALATAFGVVGAPAFSPTVSNVTWLITFAPTVALQILDQDLLFTDAIP